MAVYFPLIRFDLQVFYRESSFKRNSEILTEKKAWNSHFGPFTLVIDVYIVLNIDRGSSGYQLGIHILKHPSQIHYCGHFSGSTNFIWKVVHRIWKIMQFRHCKVPQNNSKHILDHQE